MKRKPKPKRQATRKAPHRASRKTPRPRKPAAPVQAPPVETANLPAVPSRAMVPADTQDVKDLVAANFYELATGLRHASIPQLALMDKVAPRTLMAWLPFCSTPKQFRWWRPGPGAHCERGVTCRTCQRFDNCDSRLEYVPGSFVKLCLNTLFPGRWSLDGVNVERFKEGGTDEYHASGTLVVTHNDGQVQRIYQVGTCPIRKKQDGSAVNPGFYMKGAVTDLIKKAASELGIAYDVYSGRTMQHDIPPEPGESKAETADTEKRRSQLTKLFREIDARLKTDSRSVHKSGYTSRMAWDDADRLWPDGFAADHPEFKTTAEAIDCYANLPHEEFVAIYSKVNNKWRKSDKALQDPKYGQEAPDDYRPEDAQPKPPAKPAKREAQMPADVLANFWTKVRRILGGCTQGQAEIAVNTVTRLRADRGQTKAADWLDLDAIEGQETMAVLGEEIAKGTFAHITGVRAGT